MSRIAIVGLFLAVLAVSCSARTARTATTDRTDRTDATTDSWYLAETDARLFAVTQADRNRTDAMGNRTAAMSTDALRNRTDATTDSWYLAETDARLFAVTQAARNRTDAMDNSTDAMRTDALRNRTDATGNRTDSLRNSTEVEGRGVYDGEPTSSTQAVIWLNSLLPGVFSPVYKCTAAVIGREFVLTSATCVANFSKERLSVSEAQENLAESYRFSDVASLDVNLELDLAVLKLTVEEFFTQSAVSKMVDDADLLVTGDRCTVSGWPYGGKEWQSQNVSYMSIEDCIDAYSSVPTPINRDLICATPELDNANCKEKMGWPLFCNGELTGLFSWTLFSCQRPGVYSSMRVSAPWITEATSGVVGTRTLAVVPVSVTSIAILLFHLLSSVVRFPAELSL